MNTITLPSGTYAVDHILDGFDIIEKTSRNVAFVGTDMLAEKMYVQFKNGSGYMYSDVDIDIMSALPAALSIGSFISQYVVKHFTSEKLPYALIVKGEEFKVQPILLFTGDIKDFPAKLEPGIIFQLSEGASIQYVEAKPEEPEF